MDLDTSLRAGFRILRAGWTAGEDTKQGQETLAGSLSYRIPPAGGIDHPLIPVAGHQPTLSLASTRLQLTPHSAAIIDGFRD